MLVVLATLVTIVSLAGASQCHAEDLIWRELAPGILQSNYRIETPGGVLYPEVLLFRVEPEKYRFSAALEPSRTDISSLAQQEKSLLAINANFFDTDGQALGLIIKNRKKLRELHRGGNLLTGIFLVEDSKPKIVHRNNFSSSNVSLALQAGPRLIAGGKPLKLSSPNSSSRRSGIALDKTGNVIIFITKVRFPGVSLSQIQALLMELEVQEALNFDGGSSSQLYLNIPGAKELVISGGEPIPVALTINKIQ